VTTHHPETEDTTMTTELPTGLPVDPTTRKLFVGLIEVVDSNPNGDPDRQGQPRQTPDGYGVISNQCIKRVVRDYAAEHLEADLFMARGVDLGDVQEAHDRDPRKLLAAYWDVRVWGGTLPRCGARLRGPMQISRAISLDPIEIDESGLTRTAGYIKSRTTTAEDGSVAENLGGGLFRAVANGTTHVVAAATAAPQQSAAAEREEAAEMAFKNKYKVMVSHRSGETEDTFISDLVVGLGADQLKSGAPARGERTSKYNQLLRIEEDFDKPVYGLKQ